MKTFKGFTLIELIVVMAVFLFIIGAAIGIFISIVQNQKRVLSETQLLNQISYVEEYMSKALRMAKTAEDSCILPGYVYLLTQYDTNLQAFRGIRFLNPSYTPTVCQEFFLDGSGTASNPYVLKEIKNGGASVALTPTNLQFDTAKPIRFAINGSDGSASIPGSSSCSISSQCGASNADDFQPRVTILLNVAIPGASNGKTCTDSSQCSSGQTCISGLCVPARTIQTTVSLRNLNINNGQR